MCESFKLVNFKHLLQNTTKPISLKWDDKGKKYNPFQHIYISGSLGLK